MDVDFQTLFQASPALMMVLDQKDPYRIVAVSDSYLQATLTTRDIVGRALFEVFPDNPDDPTADGMANLRRSIEEAKRTGQPHQMALQKYDVRNDQGEFEQKFWSCSNRPVAGCIIHTAEDVTELQLAYQRLQHTDRLKTQFFANVSHELRTPLTLILGPVEKLLRAQPESKDLSTIRRNATMLLKLVNDLLDLAKLDAGKLEPQLAPGDLAAHVRLACANFETVAEQRGVRLRLDIPPTLPVEFDSDMLGRVVGNLISNALKFTPASGVVRCSLHDDPILLEIADSGPGIPADQREAVFERFQQVDGGESRRVGGTGLGLPIVREFVQLHHGTVTVHEAPEGGALVRVSLPLQRAEPGAPSEVQLEGAAAELELSTTRESYPVEPGRAKVLVVEDNPEMRHFLAQTLADHYNVTTATDGFDGLTKARQLRPDAIVTDLMMPGMTGEGLIHSLRRDEQLHEIPVMLLTARADDDLKVRLLREGAQDYLPKPFWPEELKVRVANLITIRLAREMLERELKSRSEDLSEVVRDLQRHLGEAY